MLGPIPSLLLRSTTRKLQTLLVTPPVFPLRRHHPLCLPSLLTFQKEHVQPGLQKEYLLPPFHKECLLPPFQKEFPRMALDPHVYVPPPAD
jgi:hypothetical protein